MNRTQSETGRQRNGFGADRISQLANDPLLDQKGITTISDANSIDAIRGTAAAPGSDRPNRDQAAADTRTRYRRLTAGASTTNQDLRLRSQLSLTIARLREHFGSWTQAFCFQDHINFLRVVEA
jgi:hypothetical protein